ncbi:adenosine 5'-monophosphoramidase HINT2-like isoform X1 [Pectinophora gossypiella]|uniref:adenosine 5'-monophosphoramidase HINT2-like isoform X1 n=1 Tax=Pectinophora gossypiella TaxID=13191 RepID=UPI00214EDEBF|nr:adenosine 5'-monophosphoramidase HINT2-like isoform X1 [Pectinophora gossypiella]
MAPVVAQTNFSDFFGGKAPPRFIFEDEQCVVFDEELSPQAPVHFVIVPRKIIPRLCHVTDDEEQLLGHMLLVARTIALQRGLDRSGYHVIVDEDHRAVRLRGIHVFGRALHHMLWPVGPGAKL